MDDLKDDFQQRQLLRRNPVGAKRMLSIIHAMLIVFLLIGLALLGLSAYRCITAVADKRPLLFIGMWNLFVIAMLGLTSSKLKAAQQSCDENG